MHNQRSGRPDPRDHLRAWWHDYALAVAAVAIATVLRIVVDRALGEVHPFITYFGAVATVAWFGRTVPAVFSLLLSLVVASYLFVTPRHTLAPADTRAWLGIGLFVAVAAVVIAMSHAMRAARTRVEHLLEEAITTLASIGDGVITTDTAARVTNLNTVAESLTGWTNDEAAGRPLDTVFRIISESTRQPVENPALRALRDGVIVGLANHTVLIARDSTERPIDDSAAPIRSAAGEIIGCVLVFRDVTERHRQEAVLRASEARLRELADAMPQIVYESDADGRVVFANRQWFEYTGQSDAQTADLGACVHPDDLGAMVCLWDTARATGTPLQAEFRLRRAADDEYRWFLTRSVPVRDDEGRVIKWFGTSTDIHEQKEVARRLAESEAQSDRQRRLYETVLTNTPDFMYVFSLDHRVLYANEALITMWGRGHEGAIGKTFLEIGYEPWHAAMHDREIDQVRTTRQPVRGEVPFTGTSGRRLYEYIFVPVIGADGEVEAVAGTTRDVTDRQEAERTLRAGDERLRTALTAARMVAWEWTPADRKLRVSENAADVFGLPAGVGLTGIDQGLALLHPDDVAAYRNTFQKAIVDRAGYLTSYRLIRPADGQVIWIEERGQTVFDQPDGGVRLFGVAMDVTDRRQAERDVARLAAEADRERRLFAAVLSNTPDFIYTFDLDGRFVYVNTALLALWGRSLDEAVGRNFFDLGYPPELAARLQRQIQQVIDTKQPIRDETPYTSGSGERMYEYIFVPVVGAGDVVEAVAGSTRDITDRKLAEGERERLVSQLRDQDRKKDEFLATLAHELRNPLAPIRNGLHVIRMIGADETIERIRSMMERQLGQMTRLVDDLLDASRVTSGKLQLRKKRVELRTVIDAALETSRPAIEQAGHDLTITVPGDPIVVDGDPIRLAQVVSNLLTNSARYTPRGGHIRVSVTRDGRTAAVTVTDDGIGIPPAMLEAVFGMFTQVDRTLEKTTGGLGIGLSLVKGLVEMHGGTIEARSDGEGRGSDFTVRLPVASAAVSAPPPRAADAPALVLPGTRRVLVVDDNVDSAESLAQLLDMLGIEVRTAYDGEAGVAAAKAFRPDIVLCDIGMPKVNGYNVARSIRGEPWGQRILLVALTGWGQDDDRQKSANAGFDHHLVKPVDNTALMRLLTACRP